MIRIEHKQTTGHWNNKKEWKDAERTKKRERKKSVLLVERREIT